MRFAECKREGKGVGFLFFYFINILYVQITFRRFIGVEKSRIGVSGIVK